MELNKTYKHTYIHTYIQSCIIIKLRTLQNTELFEVCALLGFYTAWIGSLLPKFRNNLSVPKRRWRTTNLRCVKFHKSADLIFTQAEAWNGANCHLHISRAVYKNSAWPYLSCEVRVNFTATGTYNTHLNCTVVDTWFENWSRPEWSKPRCAVGKWSPPKRHHEQVQRISWYYIVRVSFCTMYRYIPTRYTKVLSELALFW
jgi:hypothetical protein